MREKAKTAFGTASPMTGHALLKKWMLKPCGSQLLVLSIEQKAFITFCNL